jgi:hypothetical protein
MRKYKFWIFLSIIGLFIFLAIGCPKSAQINEDLVAPAWENGEKLYYNIIANDKVIGSAHYSIFFDLNADIPVYIIQLVTSTAPPFEYFYDTSIVCFRRDNFAPIWAWRKVESAMGYNIATTRYNENKAEIWKETIDGSESNELQFNPPCFDNEMVLVLFRALRFQKARKYDFNVIVPMTLQTISNSVRKLGKTTINTTAGSFECDKIQLRFSNRIYNIFYERNEPRRLIRYQEKDSNIGLELAGFAQTQLF